MEHDITINFVTLRQFENENGLYGFVLYDLEGLISPFLSFVKNFVAEHPNPTLPFKKILLKSWRINW